jgi:hypothetical protein
VRDFLGVPSGPSLRALVRALCTSYPRYPSYTFTRADVMSMTMQEVDDHVQFIGDERRRWKPKRSR